jgi:hypothetical protein
MPNSGVQTVSGEGEFDLGTLASISDIYTRVSAATNPRTFYVGTRSPRRIRFAGGIGLSFDDGVTGMAVGMRLINWWSYINWETQDMACFYGATPGCYATHVVYRLALGVTLQFIAWW